DLRPGRTPGRPTGLRGPASRPGSRRLKVSPAEIRGWPFLLLSVPYSSTDSVNSPPCERLSLQLLDRLLHFFVDLLTVHEVLDDHDLGGRPFQALGQFRRGEVQIRLLASGGAGVSHVQHVVDAAGVEGGLESGLEDRAGSETHAANREHSDHQFASCMTR